MTPMTACRTRAAARAGSGCPESSQAMTASMATAGASSAAHRASPLSGTSAEICRYPAAVMSARNFPMRSENSGSRRACWNSSRNPAGDSAAASSRPSMLAVAAHVPELAASAASFAGHWMVTRSWSRAVVSACSTSCRVAAAAKMKPR